MDYLQIVKLHSMKLWKIYQQQMYNWNKLTSLHMKSELNFFYYGQIWKEINKKQLNDEGTKFEFSYA